MNKYLSILIMAAGNSTRLKSSIPKPFIKLNNKPLLWYSLRSFQNSKNVNNIYLIVNKNDIELIEKIKKRHLKKIDKIQNVIVGGKERHDSVYNGLKFINEHSKCDFIGIHDAARPFITTDLIDKIYRTAIAFDASAPGVNVADTIKVINNDLNITEHPKRDKLIAIQTPQIFNFKKLWKAYESIDKKNTRFTDDTEIYSKINKKVKIIQGSNELFKITYDHDLDIAKSIIRKYKKLWN